MSAFRAAEHDQAYLEDRGLVRPDPQHDLYQRVSGQEIESPAYWVQRIAQGLLEELIRKLGEMDVRKRSALVAQLQRKYSLPTQPSSRSEEVERQIQSILPTNPEL